jgi:hypothetical protein
MPWTPPPPSFDDFLDRVLSEIPEFRPIADEQLELADGEYYSTRFFDAFSSAVLECQHRLMEQTGSAQDAETVRRWLALGEDSMSDPYVANAFLETAGDDLLFDTRGRALTDQLGPLLRAALDKRRAGIEQRRRGPDDL